MRLEHIGIAVGNAPHVIKIFETLLERPPYKEERVASEHVTTHFFDAGGVKIELLEPTDDDGAVARFLEKRGPGIHHLAFEVDDLDDTRNRMKAHGFRIIGDESKAGADGKQIFFLHPKDTGNVLIEFCSASPVD